MVKHLGKLSLIIVLVVSLSVNADESPAPKPIKLMGDEIPLVRVKAQPTDFLGKPFVLTGGIQISDYFNYGYRDTVGTYYSFRFHEAVEPDKLGETCDLYLLRTIGKDIADRILANTPHGKALRLRAKVVLKPDRYKGDIGAWNMFELLDVQFPTDDREHWEPWFVETKEKKLAEIRDRQSQLAQVEADAAERKKQERAAAREKLRASCKRKWTDSSGKFEIEAEYTGMNGETVLLKKADGTILKLPLSRLSKSDAEWVSDYREAVRKLRE